MTCRTGHHVKKLRSESSALRQVSWFERTVRPRLLGRAHLVRYADDAVMIFGRESDARRVLAVLPKRFGRFGLSLHPEKTRIVQFRRPGLKGGARPGTFALLGFTHYWGRTRRGGWAVMHKTAKDRLSRALRAINEWCRRFRHLKVREQWVGLCRKLQGHYAYYGRTGNVRSLRCFREQVERLWRKWLSRRSGKAGLRWDAFHHVTRRYPLPRARLVYHAPAM